MSFYPVDPVEVCVIGSDSGKTQTLYDRHMQRIAGKEREEDDVV